MKVFLQFFLVVLAGCSNAGFNSNDYLWLDSDVRVKVQNSFEELRISRPQIEFSDGNIASNCKEYSRQKSDAAETAANYSARSHYLICDALTLADTWPPKLQDQPIKEDLSLCSSLSLAGFRHSLGPRIETENATLTQLFGEEAVGDSNTCAFEGEGRNFVLKAVFLLNEPEKPKRMWVWVIDEILDATYRSYQPVWFVFDESKSMWIATQ